jgi:hypothetical protein
MVNYVILGNFLHTVFQFHPLMKITGFVAAATIYIYFILFRFTHFYNQIHCKKKLAIFPSPAGMSLTKLSLGGNPGWGRENE